MCVLETCRPKSFKKCFLIRPRWTSSQKNLPTLTIKNQTNWSTLKTCRGSIDFLETKKITTTSSGLMASKSLKLQLGCHQRSKSSNCTQTQMKICREYVTVSISISILSDGSSIERFILQLQIVISTNSLLTSRLELVSTCRATLSILT